MTASAKDRTDRLKLAFVGCGAISSMHLLGIRDGAAQIEVTAAVDTNPEHAKAVAEQTGAAVYTSLEQALAEGDFDAVDLMLPHDLHEEAAVAAKAGVDEPTAHLSKFQGGLAVGVGRAEFEAAVLEVDHGGKLGGFEESSNGNLERDEWAQQLAGGLIPECGGSILGDRRFARPAEDGSNPEHGSVDLQLPQAQLAGQHRQQIDRPQYARDLQPRASLVWPGANSSGVQLNPIFPRNR
ncbi:MAG: Gfo/Idh/MocA family oxidoreductase [Myxococcales bacterium]|nr:Gfo/Idh/MocA family oxidoreductase [Myxococcales bacterium]